MRVFLLYFIIFFKTLLYLCCVFEIRLLFSTLKPYFFKKYIAFAYSFEKAHSHISLQSSNFQKQLPSAMFFEIRI